MQAEIFALRYQVYCLECGFLDPDSCQNGLELDEYDSGAAHFVAHNGNNELVGSLRLIHPPNSQTFPFEDHCYRLFENVILPPREESAEISRLVVRKNYRGRMKASLSGGRSFSITGPMRIPFTEWDSEERRSHSPEVLLGLFRQIYHYSNNMGIRYWYAAMERPLARALARLNFVFTPIGMETDYYGPVTPYLVNLQDLERNLAATSPALFAWFRGEAQA